MSELMVNLAENYQWGIGISSGVLIITYILISVFAIIRMYKMKDKIMISAVFPIIHIIYLFLKEKKNIKENTDNEEDVFEGIF